ncbi:transposase [uncultured Jatrophihabitans sp.]|uniref:transposase n=1 Tax=uncultured Jatrophihabitans sp. TaxID=1610747 RepID=UPI0035C9CAD0
MIAADDATVALRLSIDRRDELGVTRTQTVNRIHRLLLELLPGGAKKDLSAAQAKALLASVRPRDVVGRTRHRLAAEHIAELVAIDQRIKTATTELHELIAATGSTLIELAGIGASGAARLLGDVGDITRFADKGRVASWNGTAPLDASSGDQHRHRLSRAGNRRINHTLHIMALTALRHGMKHAPTTTTKPPPARPTWKRCAALGGSRRWVIQQSLVDPIASSGVFKPSRDVRRPGMARTSNLDTAGIVSLLIGRVARSAHDSAVARNAA